jgi:hypothetical protein
MLECCAGFGSVLTASSDKIGAQAEVQVLEAVEQHHDRSRTSRSGERHFGSACDRTVS